MGSSYYLIIMAMTGVLAATPDMFWISPKNASVYGAAPEDLSVARGVWSSMETGAGSRAGVPVFHLDSKGSMWIYGGYADADLNAIWNYDPIQDKYRWVGGNKTRNYGQQGVPADDVSPGPTSYAAHAIDKNDNIWIYGGNSGSDDDSMWMFNTTSLQFTWLGGNNTQPAVSGDLGQASVDYWPGPLQGASMVVDSKNNLWLIGGYNSGTRSTVWHFNTSSHEWSLQVNNTGATLSGPDYENKIWPGRWLPGCTIDEDDRVWLFGGYNDVMAGTSSWNDVWSFDTKTVTWRVERETNTSMLLGNVASFDSFDVANYPRRRDSVNTIDRRDGTLMLYGGRDPDVSVSFNDIWVFNKTSKQWKVVFGFPNNGTLVPNTFGTYRGAGSKLGSRVEYSIESGLNAKGNMIIFGGYDNNNVYFNDIWIIPQDQCSTNLHDCDPNASCTMASWTYTCTCNDGYTGDGKTCTAVPSAVPISQPQTQQPQSTPSKTTSGSSTNGLVPSLIIAMSMSLLYTL